MSAFCIPRGGVYPYPTAQGTRWRYVIRRSDGKQTSKCGLASQRAARDAHRRLVEQIERGEVRHTKHTFIQPAGVSVPMRLSLPR